MHLFVRDEKPKDFLKLFPVTSFLFIINVVLFIVSTILGGSKDIEIQMKLGAFYEPFFMDGQWYRLLTSFFLHFGFEHLLFNMVSLLIFAAGLERLIGSKKYTILYILSGIGANISVLFFNQNIIVVGASGAIFGIFGVFLTILIKLRQHITAEFKKTFITIITLNVLFSFIGTDISIAGHFGGLATGFILSFFMLNKIKNI